MLKILQNNENNIITMFNIKLYVRPENLEDLNKRLRGDMSILPIAYSTQDIDRLNGAHEITLSYAEFMNLKENGHIYPVNL